VDTETAILTRRSVGVFRPDAVPAEEIGALLDLAVRAPNHKLTEPWRFRVFTGVARGALGEAMAAAIRATGVENPAALDTERGKPLRAPAIVVVTSVSGKDALETEENGAAVAAAVQNFLLAAHAHGLGAIWRTGKAMHAPEVAEFLGMNPGEFFVAAVYLGYPAKETAAPGRRTPSRTFTTWYE
jgi:nitroreductase